MGSVPSVHTVTSYDSVSCNNCKSLDRCQWILRIRHYWGIPLPLVLSNSQILLDLMDYALGGTLVAFHIFGGFRCQGRRGSLKTTSLLLSLCGLGAFLLLAGLFSGLPAQAATHAPSAISPCNTPAGPTLSEDHSDGGQASDMDDDDGDDGDRTDQDTTQGPIIESTGMPVLTGRHPDQGSWSLDSLETPHSRPAHGYNLRRRILKKTR